MKFIDFMYFHDFGQDYGIRVLTYRNWSLLQMSVSWNDFPSPLFLQARSLSKEVLDIQFLAYRLGIDVTILGKNWQWFRGEKN